MKKKVIVKMAIVKKAAPKVKRRHPWAYTGGQAKSDWKDVRHVQRSDRMGISL